MANAQTNIIVAPPLAAGVRVWQGFCSRLLLARS